VGYLYEFVVELSYILDHHKKYKEYKLKLNVTNLSLKPWETQLLENSFISLTFFFTAHRKLPPRISPNNRSTTNYADLFKTNNVLSFGSQNPSFKPPDNKTLTKKHFHSNPFPFLSYASNGNFQVCGFPDAIFFLSGSIV